MTINLSFLTAIPKRSIRPIARPVSALVKSAVLALMCTGCISITDPRLGSDGKAGWIVKHYTADELRMHRPSCLAMLPTEAIDTNQYVEVTVAKGRGRRYVAAMLPATLSADVGDRVEIAPHRCEQGQVPVVRQVLEHHG